MNINKIGLITYNCPHLKTQQVLQGLLKKKKYEFEIFALPFLSRKPRRILLNHRPDQTKAEDSHKIAIDHAIPYNNCQNDYDIDNTCDVYLVLGAGILSAKCLKKKVINCHPGIIPASRGLDSFKWSLYEQKNLGVTLHYIDAEVDAGEIISIVPTPILKSDTFETLAARHYENEINTLINFESF